MGHSEHEFKCLSDYMIVYIDMFVFERFKDGRVMVAIRKALKCFDPLSKLSYEGCTMNLAKGRGRLPSSLRRLMT